MSVVGRAGGVASLIAMGTASCVCPPRPAHAGRLCFRSAPGRRARRTLRPDRRTAGVRVRTGARRSAGLGCGSLGTRRGGADCAARRGVGGDLLGDLGRHCRHTVAARSSPRVGVAAARTEPRPGRTLLGPAAWQHHVSAVFCPPSIVNCSRSLEPYCPKVHHPPARRRTPPPLRRRTGPAEHRMAVRGPLGPCDWRVWADELTQASLPRHGGDWIHVHLGLLRPLRR